MLGILRLRLQLGIRSDVRRPFWWATKIPEDIVDLQQPAPKIYPNLEVLPDLLGPSLEALFDRETHFLLFAMFIHP